jgi:hypothetical protein
MILHRGEEWMVEIMARLGGELFNILEKGLPASHGSFKIEGKREIFFDFYSDKKELSGLHAMLRNSVLIEGKKNAENETAHPSQG